MVCTEYHCFDPQQQIIDCCMQQTGNKTKLKEAHHSNHPIQPKNYKPISTNSTSINAFLINPTVKSQSPTHSDAKAQ